MQAMRDYDLCLSWYWQYDDDFARYIEAACSARGLSLLQITPRNILDSITEIYSHQAGFRTLLDRASDDLRFEPIRRFAKANRLRRINPLEVFHWAEDKATMHLELIQAGIDTPYTILIAPFVDQPILPALDLAPLGERFVLKPAVGGGGEGVMLNASTLDDIRCTRLQFPAQKYLAQAYIQPRLLSGRTAWFRCFHVAGVAFPVGGILPRMFMPC